MSTFKLINASSADQTVDVVVNAANSGLWAGGGICGVIFDACNKYKTPLKDGEAVITSVFYIKNTKAIVYAVGPDFSIIPEAFNP